MILNQSTLWNIVLLTVELYVSYMVLQVSPINYKTTSLGLSDTDVPEY